MGSHRFGRFPTWWVREGILKTGFKGGQNAGTSIAGLKCLIALSQNIEFYSLEVKLSYSDLESLTGLSRPMVSRGLKLITSLRLVRVYEGYPNTYVLEEKSGDDDKWAKLPISYLKPELPEIPNKGRASLSALKFYIQLLSDRPNNKNVMSMSYETITKKIGTQPRDIKRSIDILFNHHLITVYRGENIDKSRKEYMRNIYEIRGL